MIEIKNLCKYYGDKKVVSDVSFNIEKGKITSFIGPNGAGKSTVLSMISRLMDIDKGEVYIEGKELKAWDSKELSKKISILRQSNNINIRLTIKELVSFGRFPYCEGNLKKEDKELVLNAIEYMKLSDIKDKYLDELSGGQRQRAYIAMIIAQDTDYILLDEPLNNLDMKHSVEMMKLLKEMVNDLGKTIVIVLHDINFASCYSDNIVALKDGKLVKNSKSEDVIKRCELCEIYDMDFDITEINDKRICVYF
ncbi:MAG: ATP-binding cassette domain-containing protein [Clostridium baratii]|uniref:ABC transporter family protein n=1 Tax=Clostridium baratii str. Sullivan TaxID=1415775 RepID=A0A0A7FUS9_9CLOT|nr:ATP-binding cassette domain-containing protein [Clostridium baratii]AIY83352.1 ABC transporter family protein [Clostridium baratii str. Sullivan]MBS6006116.1 ATP-binding cassette domain-containing protein [Clostridium baratii]MDU1053188.1 ATP-binding cassette domain-containing protein [Clostridium baratii]MDU4911283.1 ATP-binding cassette domain-containing protein [Clostridium baratii]CUP12464.1 iron compound ABC transporter ATP-binding protein [Clostridium baratii]